jgi:hypothetical protein
MQLNLCDPPKKKTKTKTKQKTQSAKLDGSRAGRTWKSKQRTQGRGTRAPPDALTGFTFSAFI